MTLIASWQETRLRLHQDSKSFARHILFLETCRSIESWVMLADYAIGVVRESYIRWLLWYHKNCRYPIRRERNNLKMKTIIIAGTSRYPRLRYRQIQPVLYPRRPLISPHPKERQGFSRDIHVTWLLRDRRDRKMCRLSFQPIALISGRKRYIIITR